MVSPEPPEPPGRADVRGTLEPPARTRPAPQEARSKAKGGELSMVSPEPLGRSAVVEALSRPVVQRTNVGVHLPICQR